MKLLFQLASPARGLLFRAALWSTLSGVGGAWLVALINETLQADSGAMPRLGLEFAALSLGVLGLRWISQRQFVCLSQDSQARLRAIVSGRIAEAPYRQIESRGSAALVGVLTEDVSTVAQFFTTLPELLMNGAVVLGCLGYLGWLSWKVLLFAIAMVALGSLGYHLAELRALGHLRRAREEEDRLFRYFHALFDGAKELKLHRARRASFLTSSLGGSIEHSRSERTRGLLIYVGSASCGSFLFFVMIGLVLFVLAQPLGVEARALSGYALMFLYMMLPLDAALGALPGINRARVALEHIDRVISELPPQREGWEPVRGSEAQRFRQLALRGVTHRYQTEDGGFVLGPLDLAIEPGEVVFVIGGNGSGKSTLAKLLVGLYTPDSGEIVLNGQRVLERDLEGYRQHFSAIFSDFYLFENLVGLAAADLEQRGRELLRSLALERKVDLVGDRFSTLALSQGQRKRLALLVSYLEDRAVYLFDEWAADQDPEYREVFYRRLLPELRARGKAVVVITHDDRYFGLADRCIKLEAGKIVSSLQPHGLESAQSARALTAS